MSGCSCSQGALTHELVRAEDFSRLAVCCLRRPWSGAGRITLHVSALGAAQCDALESRVNALWASCGCGEGAAAAMLALLAWCLGLVPLRDWVAGQGLAVSLLAALAWVFVLSTLGKLAGIGWARWRLAALLRAQADVLREIQGPQQPA